MSTEYPIIPMHPDEVPFQLVIPYVDLPQRPKSFYGTPEYKTPMPDKVHPKGSPRNTTYLGSVEWAYSPASSRFDSYYLNPRGEYWLLWIGFHDENTWDWKWKWDLYAYCKKQGVDEKTAAIYLLLDAWASERKDYDLSHYFLIDEAGLLSVAEISEIARRVWWRDLI